jgi:hypothetical protein
VTELVQQHTKEYQEEKDNGIQSLGNPGFCAIERSENREQQEEGDVYPDLNPANPRNFKRPSHGSLCNASRGALTGICHAGYTLGQRYLPILSIIE